MGAEVGIGVGGDVGFGIGAAVVGIAVGAMREHKGGVSVVFPR